MKTKSLKANFIWNASYQVLLILVPLITTPYLARVLGASQVGVFSYTNSITNYFVLFATLGMGNYGVRTIASAGDDREKRSQLFWSAFSAQLCVAVPVALAYCVYLFTIHEGGFIVSLSWGLWVISAVIDVSWLFFGVENFSMPTVRSAITRIASVVIILCFVKTPDDLWIYVIAVSGAFFANAIILLPFVNRYVDFHRPTWSEVRRHFMPNLLLFAPVVASSMYLMLDKILLANIAGTVQAGYYDYSEKLSKMPLSIVTALGTVMLPHMTAMLVDGKREEAIKLLGNCVLIMECAAIGLMFGIAAISPEFASVFLGPGFEPCEFVMPVVAITIPLIAASNLVGVQYMLPREMDKGFTISVWCGAVANVALCLILLGPLGAMGAAIAAAATELVVLLVQCWIVRKELPLLSYCKQCAPFLICGLLAYGITRFFAMALFSVNGWVLLIAEVFVCAIVYCLISLGWFWRCGRLDLVTLFLKRNKQ